MDYSMPLRIERATHMPRQRHVTREEIRQAFAAGGDTRYGPILTVDELAHLLRISRKTIYEWISKGRLDGTFRKRGKHNLFWRDRALDVIFNGPDWS